MSTSRLIEVEVPGLKETDADLGAAIRALTELSALLKALATMLGAADEQVHRVIGQLVRASLGLEEMLGEEG